MMTALGIHPTNSHSYCRYGIQPYDHKTGPEAKELGGHIIDCAITCGSYGHACAFDEPPYPIQSLGAM